MHWYEIIADPDRPADGLVPVRISGDTSAAEGIDLLVEVARREGLPEEIALWVDDRYLGVCRTEEILAEVEPEYRDRAIAYGLPLGGGDVGALPGGALPPEEEAFPKYTCPICGACAEVPVPALAKCDDDNQHPLVDMLPDQERS